MKVYEVHVRNAMLIAKLTDVWERSVRATHIFLSVTELNNIKKFVPQALENVERLFVAADDYGSIFAFMGTTRKRLEMLFVEPEQRGKGFGKLLLQYGMRNYKINEVTVNEQNPQAVGFYKHLGFEVYKRTDHDEQGNIYPLLYMKLPQ